MEQSQLIQLTAYLRDFITEERWQKVNQVLQQRTRHISVVLEDIYQPHNASAVLRSCDGFGIQDIHVIENKNRFDASSEVTIGADQWITLKRHNAEGVDNTIACINELKEKGISVIATTPHEEDQALNDLDISKPLALVFGTELEGVTETVLQHADGFVKIPMYGFSESFNISVSAAICLYDLTTRLRSSDIEWSLSEEEKEILRYEWVKSSIKAGEQLVKRFLNNVSSR